MKIEPVATAHANGRIERHVVLGYAAGPERLYTEAQLRQLVEACAVAAWNTGMSLHMKQHDAREVGARCAGEIRELIKEMLG